MIRSFKKIKSYSLLFRFFSVFLELFLLATDNELTRMSFLQKCIRRLTCDLTLHESTNHQTKRLNVELKKEKSILTDFVYSTAILRATVLPAS